MKLLTSNRSYDPEMKWPIESFCKQAGIRSLAWIDGEGRTRFRAAQIDYQDVVAAFEVLEDTNAEMERAERAHELTVERIGAQEAHRFDRIKRRRGARHSRLSKPMRPSSKRPAAAAQ